MKLVSENPATLEPVGEVSVASRELCEKAIAAAKAAYPVWRWLDPREKRAIFKRAENILARRATEIGRLIAMEKGSPYAESLSVEVFGALQSLNYYGHNQGRLLRPQRAGHHTPLFFNKIGDVPLPSARPDAHHLALELPLPHPHVRRPQRADRGQHGRSPAVDDDAAHGPRRSARSSSRPACRRASSTSSSAACPKPRP